MRVERISYSRVPPLKPYGDLGRWSQWRVFVERAYKNRYGHNLPGGSYAFAQAEDGTVYYIEWNPYGDECLYLRVERLEEETLQTPEKILREERR
jgi:hypothetical protein